MILVRVIPLLLDSLNIIDDFFVPFYDALVIFVPDNNINDSFGGSDVLGELVVDVFYGKIDIH